MKEIVVFTAIVIGMVAVLIPALYLIFRRSVLRIIGAITIVLAGMGALLAYIVATIGLVQLLWIAPVAIVIILFALRYIKRRLTNPIHLLSDDIRQKLSQGDLTFTFDRNLLIRGDELGDISNSLEDLKNKTGQIIQDINAICFSLTSSANDQSEAAMHISEDASSQASSIEEVSSSIEEIGANIQNNASNAQETEKISLSAQTGIKDVFERLGKLIEATRSIKEKIGIINDIAFQTNILALNAAVEAARAGEYGRGFAVVAAEVRKLAERSKVAAEEIVELAKNNLILAEGAGQRMESMVPEVEKTTRLVQEIAAASAEQNNGTNQITATVQELNSITQKNASASEEMATNAEHLASLADQLKDHISYFKLNDTSRISDKRTGQKNRHQSGRSHKQQDSNKTPVISYSTTQDETF